MKNTNLFFQILIAISFFSLKTKAQSCPNVLTISSNSPYSVCPSSESSFMSVSADFDGDGDKDILTSHDFSDTLSLLYNNGLGVFNTKAFVHTALASPWALTANDFDGDGDIDYAVSNLNGSSFTVYKNGGSGLPVSNATYTLNDSPWGITSADFDNDGDVDIVSSDGGAGSPIVPGYIKIFKNNGAGIFTPFDTLSAGWVFMLTPIDFDADNDMDIAVADYSFGVTLYQNNGASGFAPYAAYSASGSPLDIRAEDVDSDGDADLAVLGTNNMVTVYKNSGSSFTSQVTYSTGLGAVLGLVFGDFDTDGDKDILVSSNGDSTLAYLKNNGLGSFSLVSTPLFVSPQTPFMKGIGNMAADDYDGDGKTDLAAPHLRDKGKVEIFLQSKNLDLTTLLSGMTISSNASGVNYQWMNCNTQTIINGATSQNYSATTSGDYAVILDNGTCIDTSACVNITTVGVKEANTDKTQIIIYPNPNNGNFYIRSKIAGVISIYNALGEVLKEYTLTNADLVNVDDLPKGIYFVCFSKDNLTKKNVSKIIVQ